MHTFVIAELGSSWIFGKNPLGNAMKGIREAELAGADCCKFQWTSSPNRMEQRRQVLAGSYAHLKYPHKWIPKLEQACVDAGIEFMVTVFLPEDVKRVNGFVKRFKVASLENEDVELISTMLKEKKPVLVSQGAHTNVCEYYYTHMCKMLHCTASYPAKSDSLNLSAIHTVGYDGYSDHSANVLTGAIAVACGAKIVEVHMRLLNTPKSNCDYKHSLTPNLLKQYIKNIRDAEVMLGDGMKKIEKCEEWALEHKVKA